MSSPLNGRSLGIRLRTVFCAAVLWSVAGSVQAAPGELPVLHNVGVVPVQWESTSEASPGEAVRSALNESFSAAVRASRRFRVLDDHLVENLWKDANGRRRLAQEFELQAFASLTVEPRDDLVKLHARLMGPELNTYLLESETIAKRELDHPEKNSVEDVVETLVFRLFNRLPMDISVTSVQGSYVTLSGGQRQNLHQGQKLTLIRPRVRSTHPATGTWLEFARETLGEAKILEVKPHTAVAELTKLRERNAVKVGDGALLERIAGRKKFKSVAQTEASKTTEDGTILVPPMYEEGEKPGKSEPASSPDTAKTPAKEEDDRSLVDQFFDVFRDDKPDQDQQTPSEPAPDTSQDEPDERIVEEDAPEAEPGEKPGLWQRVREDTGGFNDKIFDDLTARAGASWWAVTGPPKATTSGDFPIWLANSVGLRVTRTLIYKIKTGFGGGFSFGMTGKGNYTAYTSHARIYWEDNLELGTSLLTTWRAGAHGNLSGMGVKRESYGGGDWVRGGGFYGLGGSILAGSEQNRYDWFAEAAIMPINVGRFGYAGDRHLTESSFGWRVQLGAFEYKPRGEIQYGGSVEYGDERITLNNGRRSHLQDWSLMALARYRL